MVTGIHYTFHLEMKCRYLDILDCNQFLEIYDQNKTLTMEACEDFVANLNIHKTVDCVLLKDQEFKVPTARTVEEKLICYKYLTIST